MQYIIETFFISMCLGQLSCGGGAAILPQGSTLNTSKLPAQEVNNTTSQEQSAGAEHFGRANSLKYKGQSEAALLEYNLAVKAVVFQK